MNAFVNKMGTLICHYGKWIVELGDNVVIQKLCSNKNYIGAQCPCFHPLNGIINGN